jgi:crotonobetainyl-CoA:carnitine CoA-transferase CaiB-like acyl-CoA transferase
MHSASAGPRLVYGRMTGWGQTGPLAERAGHDIDYIAVTGPRPGWTITNAVRRRFRSASRRRPHESWGAYPAAER